MGRKSLKLGRLAGKTIGKHECKSLGEAEEKASKMDTCIGFAFEGKLKLVEELQKLQDRQEILEELATARTDIENKELEELRSNIRCLIETREEVQKLHDRQEILRLNMARTDIENNELAELRRNIRDNYESTMLLHPEVLDESIMVHFISGSKTLEETTVYESKKEQLTEDEEKELEKEPKWQIYGACSLGDGNLQYF